MPEDEGFIVVAPGRGREVIRVNGERTIIKGGRVATRGAYVARENSAPPGFAGVPLHVHRDAEEAFYVLSGRLAAQADGRRVDAEAGAFVLVPRGTVHAIANPGAAEVRWLTLISPAERGEWAGGEPDPDALAAIHRRYGLEIVGPPPDWSVVPFSPVDSKHEAAHRGA